jgi:YggT family protein
LSNISSYIWILHDIYSYMIIIYVLMSWLPSVRESFVGEFLGRLVEPYLRPFRRFIPSIGGMIDISPIIAFYALRFVAEGLILVIEMLGKLLGVL